MCSHGFNLLFSYFFTAWRISFSITHRTGKLVIFQFFLTCEWYEFLPHSWRVIFLGIEFLVNYHFIQDFESVISLTYCYCGFWWEISCLSYWRSLFSDASFFSWSFLTSFFVPDFWQFDYNTSGYGSFFFLILAYLTSNKLSI